MNAKQRTEERLQQASNDLRLSMAFMESALKTRDYFMASRHASDVQFWCSLIHGLTIILDNIADDES